MDIRKDKNSVKWIVYEHQSPSGKIYVGITHYKNPNVRWQNGKGYNRCPFFWPAIQKYGWDNIEHKIIATNLSRESACDIEKSLIKKYKKLGISYNSAEGGEGVQGKKSDIARKHISESNRSREPKVRQKISNSLKELHLQPWNKGKTGVYSEETRYRMGAGTRGKPGVNLGRKMPPVSEETRKKISLANKGKTGWSKGKKLKPLSEETRKKISENLKGKRLGIPLGPRPEDVKEKISRGRIGQKWVCKPWMQPKQIPQDEVEQYVNDGWNLGKIIKHNGKYYKWLSKESKWIEYLPATKF